MRKNTRRILTVMVVAVLLCMMVVSASAYTYRKYIYTSYPTSNPQIKITNSVQANRAGNGISQAYAVIRYDEYVEGSSISSLYNLLGAKMSYSWKSHSGDIVTREEADFTYMVLNNPNQDYHGYRMNFYEYNDWPATITCKYTANVQISSNKWKELSLPTIVLNYSDIDE